MTSSLNKQTYCGNTSQKHQSARGEDVDQKNSSVMQDLS